MRGVAGALLALLVLGTLSSAGALRNLQEFKDTDGTVQFHWAVLVAGSKGWGNYRHQADICHAYHVLREGGLDESKIVVMMADDIAHSSMNPYPGKLFNAPHGRDVYNGVPKDYTGAQVTAHNFLSVLAGLDMKGVGSGKTIKSGPNDRVFVYYADHGAPGVVGMPEGPFLYADELNAVIRSLADRKHFKEMVVYIEACESGSMFQGLLDKKLPVFATTAANAYESSWGTYCPGQRPGPKPGLNTCMGDLYSVSWLEDAERSNLTQETLQQQFRAVRKRTSHDYTYQQGSHVLEFGNMPIAQEVAGNYLGMLHTGHKSIPGVDTNVNSLYDDGKKDAYLTGYATDDTKKRQHDSLAEAEDACTALDTKCGGVTYEPGLQKYTVRKGKSCHASFLGEVSWLKKTNAPKVGRIIEEEAADAARAARAAVARLLGLDKAKAKAKAPKDEQLVDEDGLAMLEAMPAREAELVPLVQAYLHAQEGSTEKHTALLALDAALTQRATADNAIRGVVDALLTDASLSATNANDNALGAQAAMLAAAEHAWGLTLPTAADSANALDADEDADVDAEAARAAAVESIVEAFVLSPINADEDAPVVKDFDCLRDMVTVYEACGTMDGYSMKHTRALANLCDAGVTVAEVEAAAGATCAASRQ